MKVFVLFHFLDDDNLSVARCDHNALGVAFKKTYGTAKEIHNDKIKRYRQHQQEVEKDAGESKSPTYKNAENGQADSTPNQGLGAFAMETDFLS